MSLSNELQIGKAGEHLVCCDLILQGYNAFLSGEGLPYDVVVDCGSKIIRIQVKTTTKLVSRGKAKNVYWFGVRRGVGSRTKFDIDDIDYFAFVALNVKKIAYLPISDMITKDKSIKQTMVFKTIDVDYKGRIYSNGTVRNVDWGRYIESHSKFNPDAIK